MRMYKDPIRNALYTAYRIVRPVFDPLHTLGGILGYSWYVRDLIEYAKKDPSARLVGPDIFPVLDDKKSLTPFDSHYFFQQRWAFQKILRQKPARHVDIGSQYQFSGYVSLLCKTEFVDIRPIDTKTKNLKIIRGDMCNLPYPDNSVASVSSLHVLEHIGLGRYGDPIDPLGPQKACRELVRVAAPGGRVYISVPVGRTRVCFNAHRVYMPRTIMKYTKGLQLIDFSLVDDSGIYHEAYDFRACDSLDYGCGMFTFTKS